MTNLDDDRAFLAARQQATRLADQPKPDTPPPERIPEHQQFLLRHAGPGWTLYSTTRFRTGTNPDIHDPLGGVCAEKVDVHSVDPDTGEIDDQTRYRCYTFNPHQPWVTLDATEVDTSQLAGLDRISSTAAIRRLIRPLVRPSTPKTLTRQELDDLHDAWRLAAATAL